MIKEFDITKKIKSFYAVGLFNIFFPLFELVSIHQILEVFVIPHLGGCCIHN